MRTDYYKSFFDKSNAVHIRCFDGTESFGCAGSLNSFQSVYFERSVSYHSKRTDLRHKKLNSVGIPTVDDAPSQQT